MKSIKCKECNKTISKKSKFCTECGAPVWSIKRVVFWILGVIFTLLVFSKNLIPFDLSNTPEEELQEYFESNKEPQVTNAYWKSKNIFEVVVIYDGKTKDSYAKHVCNVLHEKGIIKKRLRVHVVDKIELSINNKSIIRGKARCQ